MSPAGGIQKSNTKTEQHFFKVLKIKSVSKGIEIYNILPDLNLVITLSLQEGINRLQLSSFPHRNNCDR